MRIAHSKLVQIQVGPSGHPSVLPHRSFHMQAVRLLQDLLPGPRESMLCMGHLFPPGSVVKMILYTI